MEYQEIDLLRDKQDLIIAIFTKILKEARKFGPVQVEIKKTCVHLKNRYGFAGIYIRNDHINLEIHLSHKLSGKKISKVDQASANRYHHVIKLMSVKDVDHQLLKWLKEAYELKA